MKRSLQVLAIACSILTGAVFVYSGITKLLGMEVFEYTIVKYLQFPWLSAAVTARLFTGLECTLGLLLMACWWGARKVTVKVAMVTLLVFSVYLVWMLMRFGNSVNCGCFGEFFQMSPAESLLKNALLALLLIFVGRVGVVPYSVPRGGLLQAAIYLAATAATVIANPFFINKPDWLQEKGYMLQMTPFNTARDMPAVNLTQGKHLVVFLSQHCPHCRMAASKLRLMFEADPQLPILLVIAGESDLNEFFAVTHAEKLPRMRMGKDDFLRQTGGIFPTLLFVEDGLVVGKTNYLDLNTDVLHAWLNNKKAK